MRSQRLGCFIACVLGLFASIGDAWAESALQVVGIPVEGAPTAWTAPLESLKSAAGFDAVWIWSDVAAPRRFSIAAGEESWRAVSRDELTIAVQARSGGRKLAALSVLAAPVEMWDEVPESLLPTKPMDASGRATVPCAKAGDRWRIRLVERATGSWWRDVVCGSRPDVELALAAPRTVQVLDAQGKSWAAASATVMTAQTTGRVLAQLRAGNDGVLHFAQVPDESRMTLLVGAQGAIPRLIEAKPTELPEAVRLESGTRLSGRIVDVAHRGVADVSVAVESMLDAGVLFRRVATTAPDGRWTLPAVPRRDLAVTASKEGFARFRQSLTPKNAVEDAGAWTLQVERTVEIRVVDDRETPVAAAALSADPDVNGKTDPRGVARLRGLTPGESVALKVSKPGYITARAQIPATVPPGWRVVLARAFVVKGRYVEASGAPLEGKVQTWVASASNDEAIGADGRFSVELAPDVEAELLLLSPRARERRIPLPAGKSGEIKDLGDVVAAKGLRAIGSLVDCRSSQPVVGARVWTLRSGTGGPALAALLGNTIETRSNGRGVFELSGLAGQEPAIEISAQGLAPRRFAVAPGEDPEAPVDLGVIDLCPGPTLRVNVDRAESDGARVEVEGSGALPGSQGAVGWVHGKVGEVANVPVGRVTVSVHQGDRDLCVLAAVIPEGVREPEVDCPPVLRLEGEVTVGRQPAGPGHLVWQAPGNGGPGAILTQTSSGGARGQQTFGGPRPPTTVAVDSGGAFATEDLRSGSWDVSWAPDDGPPLASIQVPLPAVAEYHVRLDFPAFTIAGRVVDREGQGVSNARVEDVGRRAFGWTAADGSFRLEGLGPGRYTIRASLRDLSSEPATVDLGPDGAPEPLRLVLDDQSRRVVEVEVVGPDGSPAADAFVFLQLDDASVRLVTADGSGRARFTLVKPFPKIVRAADHTLGGWSLGEWQALTADSPPLAIGGGAGGTLSILGAANGIPLTIESAKGWRLDQLLLQMGIPAVPSEPAPAIVAGVPAGRYILRLGAQQRVVAVEAGGVTSVTFDAATH
ncbi:MAG: carboxypeptidase-like regulatory domain-containing protein [Acidobacteriota bacterium]